MKHSILTFATFLLAAAGSALYSQHPPTLMTNHRLLTFARSIPPRN